MVTGYSYFLFRKLGVKNSEVFLLFMDFYGICMYQCELTY